MFDHYFPRTLEYGMLCFNICVFLFKNWEYFSPNPT